MSVFVVVESLTKVTHGLIHEQGGNPSFPTWNKVLGPLQGACALQVCWAGHQSFFLRLSLHELFEKPSIWHQWGFLQAHPGGNFSQLHLISVAAPKCVSSKTRLEGWEQQEPFHLIFCTKAISSKSLDSTPASKKESDIIDYFIAGFLSYSFLLYSGGNPSQSSLNCIFPSFRGTSCFLRGGVWKYSCFLFLFSSICTSLATSKNTHIKMS